MVWDTHSLSMIWSPWDSVTSRNTLHDTNELGDSDWALTVLLHLARRFPHKTAWSVVDFVERAIWLELENEEMLWLGPQSHALGLCCFHLYHAAIRCSRVVDRCRRRKQSQAVVMCGEHLPDTPHKMTIEREFAPWEERL